MTCEGRGGILRRTKRYCVAVLIFGLAVGCSSDHGSRAQAGPPAGAPADIEGLASKIGCTQITGKRNVRDLRQGTCRTSQGRYTMVTFGTDRNRDAWLSEATKWGGAYLVGSRFAVVGTPQSLESIKAKVGGELKMGDAHH
ncbi:hypothetical protein [Actinomadura decatromicini]|uniref:Lipoprotein n=1 Tax=Actinomadura decatromicini TaxID=2604572 RepID=A0A5D3F6T7_9ACTN|nr:hypothetical protein [Actinomadura decatromicini]TYK43055.1 hypothetical protein FXF68_39940 [Actinomadura decatromicini]